MRIIVPFTRIAPETAAALDASGYEWEAFDVAGTDSAYHQLLEDLWAKGEDFLINEHDIVPNKDTFKDIEACPEPWCVAPFPYLYGTFAGLGVARFRAELMQKVPDLLHWVGTRERLPRHPQKHWCMLAEWVGTGLGNAGFKDHWHEQVDHVGDCLPSHNCVPLERFRKGLKDFVVHTPAYSGSAGIRALHILAKTIRSLGRQCCIQIEWGVAEPGRPDPYQLDTVQEWDSHAVRDAIHIYPEGMTRVSTHRNVWWMLNTPHPPYTPEGGLYFTWDPCLMPNAPRLQVDVVEPEWFFPKTAPGVGAGALVYAGKGHVEDRLVPRDAQWIGEWPPTRKLLGQVLRDADILYSFDGFSAIDLEASICGTPVVLLGRAAQDPRSRATYEFGVSPSEDQARATVGLAFNRYQGIRHDILGDVDHLIKTAEAHFA